MCNLASFREHSLSRSRIYVHSKQEGSKTEQNKLAVLVSVNFPGLVIVITAEETASPTVCKHRKCASGLLLHQLQQN